MAGRWQTKTSVEIGRGVEKTVFEYRLKLQCTQTKNDTQKNVDLRCLSPSAVEDCAQKRRMEPMPTQEPRQVYSNKEMEPVIKSISSRKNLKTVNL